MTVTQTWPFSRSSTVAPKMMLVSSVAAPRTTSAASLTSSSVRSSPPAIESRMPLAPTISVSISGDLSARSAASRARFALSRVADAHQRRAGVRHDRAHVGEVEVDQAGHRDQVADALHALPEHVVGDLERVDHRRRAVEHLEQPVVRDHDHRVARGAQRLDAGVGRLAALRALEPERRRHDADGERAELAGDPRHDGRCTGAGASALAGGDEHHVGAAQRRREPGRTPPRRPDGRSPDRHRSRGPG